ncbi:MAG: McrC family protein [Gemmataceae bacterium]|nr:McrC family protein [Gemmataceae bacterium]
MTRRTVRLVERRTRAVRLPRAEADFLVGPGRTLVDLVPLPSLTLGARQYRLTPRGFVGVLDGPTVRYDIGSKLPWANLLMLLGLADRPFGGGEPAAGLLDLLARELADRMREVARAGLVGGYGEADRASPFLRGRLRAADQLRDTAARAFPDRFHVTEDVYDLDTPWNRVPKRVALDLLRRPDLSPAARDGLTAALVPFADVPDGPATDAEFDAAGREPRAAAYNGLLTLCRLLRDGLSAADPTSSAGGGFLIDLGRAFERHLAATARAAVGGRPGWAVEDQPRFVAGSVEFVPDVLVRRRGDARLVLDAKWKRVGPDPADLHQVLAYAAVTGAAHVALVYPGRKPGWRSLAVGRVTVTLARLPAVGSVSDCQDGGRRLLAAVLRHRPCGR